MRRWTTSREDNSKHTVGIRRAAAIQLVSKVLSVGVQLVVTAVLARLIAPGDFGLLALATVFLAFFNMFADMGIGAAIVQYRELDDGDFGALFGFSILLSLALSGLFCAFSPLMASIYGDDRLVSICCLGSISLLFNTLNLVPNGLMLRSKEFASIGVRLVVSSLASGAIAILLAIRGWGCYALVWQMILSAAFVFAWNLMKQPIKRLSLSFVKPLRRIWAYSAYQLGFNLINYLARNFDNLLLGKAFGTVPLGYYDKAYKLTVYPVTMVSSIMGPVIQPFMAEHQDEVDVVFSYWERIEKLLSLLSAPIASVLICAAPEIVLLIYGDQWISAIPLFQVLSASVYFQMMNSTSGAFFQSLGRTDYLFITGLINACVTASGVIVGIFLGDVIYVAVFVSGSYVVHSVFIAVFLVRKAFGKPFGCLRVFLPEVFFGCCSVAVYLVFASTWSLDIVSGLLAKCACILAVFAVGYGITGQYGWLASALYTRRIR